MKTDKLKKLINKPRSTVAKGIKLGTRVEIPKVKYSRRKKHKNVDDI